MQRPCHDLHVLHTPLYRSDGHTVREPFMRRSLATDADLLVLDSVPLDPRWRGLQLSLLAARKAVDRLGGGCGLTVAEVAPVRRQAIKELCVPPSGLPANQSKAARREAVTKLRRYFRRMGFERLGRTPFCVLPVGLTTPTAADLLGQG